MTNLHDIGASAGQLPTYIINGRCTASDCRDAYDAQNHHNCYSRDGIAVYYCIDDRHPARYYYNREKPDGTRDMSQYCPEHRGNPL